MAVGSQAEEEKDSKSNKKKSKRHKSSDTCEKLVEQPRHHETSIDLKRPPGGQETPLLLHKVQFARQSCDESDSDEAVISSPTRRSNNPLHHHEDEKKRKRTLSEGSYFSAASIMSGSSSSNSSSVPNGRTSSTASYSYNTAPDGGWGWVIVIAAFMVNMIADGITFSFGVLFDELQEEFGESKAVTAGVVSLFHAVPLLSGPVSSALTDRYGCRKTTIIGALLATLGFLLSSITYRLELLYLTFGLLSGFGLSLCYVAAVVIVAYYFDRRRSFATGISVCGSGVGTFVFAPLTQYLIEEYGGWRGATVILAGFFLNMVICGALFRDLEWTKKRIFRARKIDKNNSTEASSSPTSMPEIDQLRILLESGDIGALFSQEELQDCPRLSSSLVDLPTFISQNEPLPEEVLHALSRNKAAHKLIVETYPDSLIARSLSDNNEEPVDPVNKEDTTTGTKLKRKVSSLFKKKPVKPILKRTVQQAQQSSQLDAEQNKEHMFLNHLKVRRQSLTYRGAMLNISRYRLRASSCPDIYRNSMTTIALDDSELDETFRCCRRWHQFMNPAYLVFALSNFILYAWYDVMYVYLYNYAEIDLSFASRDATFLLSMIGILNTFGEVIIGWLGDQARTNLNLLYAICMVTCGVATAVVPFLTDYSALASMAGLFGLCISANYSLTSPILVELVSLEQFSNAYGLLLLAQGISNLIGPPFAGFLYDQFKIWHYTFGLGGVFIAISGLLLLVLPCIKRVKQRSTRDEESGVEFNEEENEEDEVFTVMMAKKHNTKRTEPIDIPNGNGHTVL